MGEPTVYVPRPALCKCSCSTEQKNQQFSYDSQPQRVIWQNRHHNAETYGPDLVFAQLIANDFKEELELPENGIRLPSTGDRSILVVLSREFKDIFEVTWDFAKQLCPRNTYLNLLPTCKFRPAIELDPGSKYLPCLWQAFCLYLETVCRAHLLDDPSGAKSRIALGVVSETGGIDDSRLICACDTRLTGSPLFPASSSL